MPNFLQRYYELHTITNADTVAEGRQFTPSSAADLSEWCGGEVRTEDGQTVFVVPAGPASAEARAKLGDFVMHFGIEWWVEPAGGLYQRWHDSSVPVEPIAAVRMYAPYSITYGANPWH